MLVLKVIVFDFKGFYECSENVSEKEVCAGDRGRGPDVRELMLVSI